MSAHTPGPWVLVHDEPYEMSIEARGEEVPGISLWLDDACFDLNPTRIANGRLIAAAPDLYEALALAERMLREVPAEVWLNGNRAPGVPIDEGTVLTNRAMEQIAAALRAAGRLP